jgi:hypothetical protein
LTRILKDIAANEKFQHFDVHFIDNPITYLVRKKKVNISELLESVDSLHPNQVSRFFFVLFHNLFLLGRSSSVDRCGLGLSGETTVSCSRTCQSPQRRNNSNVWRTGWTLKRIYLLE